MQVYSETSESKPNFFYIFIIIFRKFINLINIIIVFIKVNIDNINISYRIVEKQINTTLNIWEIDLGCLHSTAQATLQGAITVATILS